MSAQREWQNLHNRTTMALYPWSDNSALTAVSLVSASASAVTMPRTVRPRRQRPDNQANIAILNERIATLEAELCAEQRRSAYYRADFDRERNRADCEGEHVDRQREHADRRTGSPTHLVGRS